MGASRVTSKVWEERPLPIEVIPNSLFKFYSERRWAERFLAGELLCWSVSYYRDLEDESRGDKNEGSSEYRPQGGLLINNHTRNIFPHFEFRLAFLREAGRDICILHEYVVSRSGGEATRRDVC